MSCSFCSCSEEAHDLILSESIAPLDKWSQLPLLKKMSSLPGIFNVTDSPLFKSKHEKTNCVELPRGGCVVITKSGPIQFGIPPETIKDSLNLGFEIPNFYVIPSQRWDKMFLLSVAEFEFPAYFNFFVRKNRITLICSKEAEEAIRRIFQETLLGPTDFESFKNDFFEGYDAVPDIEKELKNFAKNPFNLNEPLTVDLLLRFEIFDENGLVYLPNDVTIRKDKKYITILEEGEEIASIRDRIKIRVSEEIEDYADKWRYGLFMNPSVEIDPKKLQIYQEKYKPVGFTPPQFGVTILGSGHGFDPKGNNSGYIIWINGRGVMVDPPPFTTHLLKKIGVPSLLIQWIIITHCHADHDAGTFQKILESGQVEIITTRTILGSFVRKYAAVFDMKEKDILGMFKFRPVLIGAPFKFNGATFNFYYSLHTIPCIGFTISFQNKSIYFSADTYYDPENLKKLVEKGVISEKRMASLLSNKWNHDLIFHEAGVPPIHTPMKILQDLPIEIKEKLYLVHVAAKDVPKDAGLKIAKVGLENTIKLDVEDFEGLKLMRTLDILSSIELFEKSSLKNVRDLIDSSVECKFNKGDMICREGDAANDFFVILNGIVKISKKNAFERYCSIGDYFGESALKSDSFGSRFRQADVEAATDVILLTIKKHDFWFVYGDNSEIISKMLNLITVPRSKSLTVLVKNSFFCHLTSSQKIQMELIMREKTFAENEVVWEKNSSPNYAVIIKKGELEFFDCKEAEMPLQVDVGSFFGEVDCFLNDSMLTTSLRAKTETEVFVIWKKELIRFLKNNLGLMMLLMKIKFIP